MSRFRSFADSALLHVFFRLFFCLGATLLFAPFHALSLLSDCIRHRNTSFSIIFDGGKRSPCVAKLLAGRRYHVSFLVVVVIVVVAAVVFFSFTPGMLEEGGKNTTTTTKKKRQHVFLPLFSLSCRIFPHRDLEEIVFCRLRIGVRDENEFGSEKSKRAFSFFLLHRRISSATMTEKKEKKKHEGTLRERTGEKKKRRRLITTLFFFFFLL